MPLKLYYVERKIIDGFFEPQSCQIIMKIGGVNAFHSAKGSTYSYGFLWLYLDT